MRKIIFSCVAVFVAIAAMSLTSCSEAKKEAVKVGEYTLVEGQDGKFGLANETGVTILQPNYDEIAFDKQLGVVVAKSSGVWSLVIGSITEVDDSIVKTEPAVAGYTYLYASDGGKYLVKNGSMVWGKYDDIAVIGNYLFFRTGSAWGAATLDHSPLAPRQFDKVYVLENGSTFAVAVSQGANWKLFDKNGVSDGVEYDISSAQIGKLLKDANEPCGVVKVDMQL